ncbi:hypothetical protein [Cellulomonas shaoxiangyii]|uniref:Uncharacterized protein n=1 Tax=Cellulomonas shaoxiangyii TaxID=2566013 RepID=A0A4P7SN96_9CELL|nr:hypothetical protein [Cellulomonas shaoxiangyii]QCB94736.1 hypothetical protein E5225_15405 [Cellulomonas shaoxiangyii]TGY86466.1 hypothetical protein E5226_01430 [Cellulomonas shaoxiangyii]
MRPLFSTADALPKNLSLHIDELRRAVADMRWSTSPHPRATVFADGRYCVEDEPGCYSPVPVVADAVRRVLCGAGLGALRDAPVLHSWIGFTTHTAGGASEWDDWLSNERTRPHGAVPDRAHDRSAGPWSMDPAHAHHRL